MASIWLQAWRILELHTQLVGLQDLQTELLEFECLEVESQRSQVIRCRVQSLEPDGEYHMMQQW